jgi:hypothetical protein
MPVLSIPLKPLSARRCSRLSSWNDSFWLWVRGVTVLTLLESVLDGTHRLR